MLSDVKSFLRPTVKAVCQMMSLKGDDGNLLTTDSTVELSATIALGQIEAYIRRPLHQVARIEMYPSIWDTIYIKNSPIVSVTEVKIGDSVLTVDEDYTISPDIITIHRPDEGDTFAIGDDLMMSTVWDVIVSYTGGYLTSEYDFRIFSALIAQTSAVFNRKEMVGIRSFASALGGGSHSYTTATTTPGDTGGLVDATKSALDGFIFYGKAIDQ